VPDRIKGEFHGNDVAKLGQSVNWTSSSMISSRRFQNPRVVVALFRDRPDDFLASERYFHRQVHLANEMLDREHDARVCG